jgi:hypothetical protein
MLSFLVVDYNLLIRFVYFVFNLVFEHNLLVSNYKFFARNQISVQASIVAKIRG